MALSKLTHVLNAKLIDDRLDQAQVCAVAGFKIRYRVFVGLPRFLLPLNSFLPVLIGSKEEFITSRG